MAIRRRTDSPFWWYDFGFRGRRFRGSTGQTTKATALAEEARIRATTADRTSRPHVLTLDVAAARYWDEHADRLPSAADIKRNLRLLIAGIGAETCLHDVTNAAVATYAARRRARVSDASVNREVDQLRALMRMAEARWGIAVAKIDWRSQRLREPAPRDVYLTPAEADRLLSEAAEHLRGPIIFSLCTGARWRNVADLDWSQIDMQRREVTFRQKSKMPGGKPHIVPLAEPAFIALANLGPREHGPVWLYKGPNRVWTKERAVTDWMDAWRKARERAGLEHVRWHDLRSTAASWMIQAGVPLDVVQQILGHADIRTTQRYAYRDTTAKRVGVDALAGHWQPERHAKRHAVTRKHIK